MRWRMSIVKDIDGQAEIDSAAWPGRGGHAVAREPVRRALALSQSTAIRCQRADSRSGCSGARNAERRARLHAAHRRDAEQPHSCCVLRRPPRIALDNAQRRQLDQQAASARAGDSAWRVSLPIIATLFGALVTAAVAYVGVVAPLRNQRIKKDRQERERAAKQDIEQRQCRRRSGDRATPA